MEPLDSGLCYLLMSSFTADVMFHCMHESTLVKNDHKIKDDITRNSVFVLQLATPSTAPCSVPSRIKSYRIGLGRHQKRVAQEFMSTNLKEKQMFCKKVFAEYTKEEWQNSCSYVKTEEKMAVFWVVALCSLVKVH
jgi:hypothetical protein